MGRSRFKRYSVCGAILAVALITFAVVFIVPGQVDRRMPETVRRENKKMTGFTREEVTRRAANFGDPIQAALKKPETIVEQIPTEYLSNGGVFRVVTQPPDRPRVYYLGVWGSDGIALLNNEPDRFFDLAANSGLSLRSGSDRVAYITTFIDVTRDFTGGAQILNTIEDSWWLPSPTPDEAHKRDEVVAKYEKIVEPPHLSRDSDSTVIVYVIRDRTLIRMNAKIENDGRIKITKDKLETGMPTVMLR